MIIAQGWKQLPNGTAVVRVVRVETCTSGMRGWDLSVGEYQPDAGESITNVRWEFVCSGAGLLEMLRFNVADEMATWIDSQQAAIDVKSFCLAFTNLAQQMFATIEAHVPTPPLA